MTRAEEVLKMVAEMMDAEHDPELHLTNTGGYSHADNSQAGKGTRYKSGKKPAGVTSGTGSAS